MRGHVIARYIRKGRRGKMNGYFVTAEKAISHYWADDHFSKEIKRKGQYIHQRLDKIVNQYGKGNLSTKGRGMFRGINCINGEIAGKITSEAFKNGLIIETSGADDHVVKFLCPLVITDENLTKGIDIVEQAIRKVCAQEDIPKENVYFEDDQREQ